MVSVTKFSPLGRKTEAEGRKTGLIRHPSFVIRRFNFDGEKLMTPTNLRILRIAEWRKFLMLYSLNLPICVIRDYLLQTPKDFT